MHSNEPLIEKLQIIIHWAVRVLAILMVFVIIMGVIDVAWTLQQKLFAAPRFILTITDMLAAFGAFMAVLIAIEIFINITIYLRDDVIHVKIVMATALMAIARKVIILDLETVEASYLWGIASIVLAISIGYWLVVSLPRFDYEFGIGSHGKQKPANAALTPERTDLDKPLDKPLGKPRVAENETIT
ncbi:phosphate-starvation-inducible PsiE family protein [Cardiobacterium sp. AH-315-I02]|nr:phosphate-starvation-inducible PsiE family protein [Cardiobacterium sp. AH-315-I02]